MRGPRASTLLRAPVLVRGIRLGEVEDVILDVDGARVLGLDVLCGDGFNRFLPLATARLTGRAVETDSALTFLERRELDFYRANGRTLATAPELADAVVEPGGALVVPLTARC